MMKIVTETAGFAFKLADSRVVQVLFLFVHGKPTHVEVQFSDRVGDCRVSNQDGRWKPCATHCKRLIEQAVKAQPKQPRVEKRKSTLKIYRG